MSNQTMKVLLPQPIEDEAIAILERAGLPWVKAAAPKPAPENDPLTPAVDVIQSLGGG